MDSTMYFCSGLERCSNRMPVDSVISTSSGHVSMRSNGALLRDLVLLSATALGAAAGCVCALTAALTHHTNKREHKPRRIASRLAIVSTGQPGIKQNATR